MMHFMYSMILVIGALSIHDISAIPGFDGRFTLSGQVIYPTGARLAIPPDSLLIIDLEDISVTDNLVTTIAQHITTAIVFPIIFNINYAASQIIHGHVHVLNAKIINSRQDILFLNEKRIVVKLLGSGRTQFIDVPVVPIRQDDYLAPSIKLLQWPELVGKDGHEAVEMIRKQTGYEHVFVVTDESKITKDLRYDRVCVYVDENNKVKQIPRTG